MAWRVGAAWRRRPRWLHGMALLAVLTLAAALAGPQAARARVGDARAGLYVGTTTYAVESYSTYGVTFGGHYGYEFQDNLLWTVGGRFSSTDGTGTVTDASGNPQVVDLQATSSALQFGLLAYFNRGRSNVFVPFVGGGLSALNYKFTFPGTTVGTTRGTAPGAYTQAGVEIRLSRNFTLIPQLGIQVHTIRTESGASAGLVSGGLVFTLRING